MDNDLLRTQGGKHLISVVDLGFTVFFKSVVIVKF